MEAKKRLARTITAGFHGEAAAASADENWARMFQQKETAEVWKRSRSLCGCGWTPEAMQIRLPKLLVQTGAGCERSGGQPQDRREGREAGWRGGWQCAEFAGRVAGADRGAAGQAGQGCGDCVGFCARRLRFEVKLDRVDGAAPATGAAPGARDGLSKNRPLPLSTNFIMPAKAYPCPCRETLGPTQVSIRPGMTPRKARISFSARALSASVASGFQRNPKM